jgi:hypothetical protein
MSILTFDVCENTFSASNVRYAPESNRLLRCREMTLWAISNILHCEKAARLFPN